MGKNKGNSLSQKWFFDHNRTAMSALVKKNKNQVFIIPISLQKTNNQPFS